MLKIVFVEHNGNRHEVEAEAGLSIMQVAVNNLLPGILADCGGTCSCATCHAYVDDDWFGRLPLPSEDEQMMLEGALEQRPNSRLTCQVMTAEHLDGAVFHLPASQC
ncbi:MAG: 2Fe-2S iron-sulfur cluster-binding protein [Rhodocyclaceae bacterium]|jgi:2Fe-2S ferredoxin|nr:2Fe-2S iron-sulfur cluster-binding protein [Rhodocyclaceae bacterium]